MYMEKLIKVLAQTENTLYLDPYINYFHYNEILSITLKYLHWKFASTQITANLTGRCKYGSHSFFSVMFNSLLTCKGLLKIDGKGRGSINQDYLNNSLQRLLHPPEGVTGTGQVRLHSSLFIQVLF